MFSFKLPREINVSIKVCEFKAEIISWKDLQDAIGNISRLLNTSPHENGKIFTIQSDSLFHLKAYTRGMVAFFDALSAQDIINRSNNPTFPTIPRPQPALTVQLHSNALHPRALFIHYLNSFIDTFGIHIYFEQIEKGIIAFIEDRVDFAFLDRAITPPFVDMVSRAEESLQHTTPNMFVAKILGQLGVLIKPVGGSK